MSLGVTEHFSIYEFACRDESHTPYPVGVEDMEAPGRHWLSSRLLPLCQMLEVIRKGCSDRHIGITSGYRTDAYNARIGGAKKSQHCQGRAVDIQVEGMPPSEVHAIILALYSTNNLKNLGGIGLYSGWCHVDIRPRVNDHLCTWFGTRIGSEIT